MKKFFVLVILVLANTAFAASESEQSVVCKGGKFTDNHYVRIVPVKDKGENAFWYEITKEEVDPNTGEVREVQLAGGRAWKVAETNDTRLFNLDTIYADKEPHMFLGYVFADLNDSWGSVLNYRGEQLEKYLHCTLL